jgi:chemotaxis protein histidine kinase CheA
MTTVRRYTTPNRLAHFVNTADGITLADALARADANLEEIRPPSLQRIDEALAELGAKAPAAPTPAEVDRLYRLANELAGTAAVFGLTGLGRAAYSLCELLDVLKSAPAWNAAAVTVHLEGLRLLRGEDSGALTPEAIAAVLAGLDKVVARVSEAR